MIDIRNLKKKLSYLNKQLGDNSEYEDIINQSTKLTEELSIVENNIHMTKNQSYQDPLNYGIRINNRLAFLMSDQQRGDFPPTDQAVAFKKEVEGELAVELNALQQIYEGPLNKLNKAIEEKGIGILVDNKEEAVN